MRAAMSRMMLATSVALPVLALTVGCGTTPGAAAKAAPLVVSPVVSDSPEPTRTPADPPTPTAAPPTRPSRPPRSSPPPTTPTAPTASDPVKRPRGTGPAGSFQVTGRASVALTFDDGPDPAQTPALLDLLAQHNATATFCVVGTQAKAYPDLIRRIVAGGHTLCNHSWDHNLQLGGRKPADIRADLAATNAAIRAAAPNAPIAYFRAPGGNFTERLASIAADLGMRSLYWQVDPRDWDHTADASDQAHRERVIATIEKSVGKGAIILSHDFQQPQTIKAYQTLLPWLQKRYHIIALPVKPDNGPAAH
jgi:peptidoglycan/xylan/chitin deacetylase (PgdA/CDA1 family)